MQNTTKQNSRIRFSEAQKERWRRALAARKKEIENGSARQKNEFLGVFLLACPELAEQFPWEDLSGSGWSFLLSGRPEFAGRCPWDELTGEDWGNLLYFRPMFADKCDWEKLDGCAWGHLLQG